MMVVRMFSPEYWSPGRGMQLASEWRWVTFVACLLYLPIILLIQKLMKPRKSFTLKGFTFLWNSALSALSFTGAAVMVLEDPGLVTRAHQEESTFMPGTRAVIAMFCLTKVVEFGDTVLLTLQKKKVSFLHKYHHLSVALYCWHSQYLNVNFAHIFVLANLVIHGVMYGYYAVVTAAKSRWTEAVRPYISLSQLLQMFVGVAISTNALYSTVMIPNNSHWLNAQLCLLIYVSHAFLFCHLYLKNYQKQFRAVMASFLGMYHIFALVGVYRMYAHPKAGRLLLEVYVLYVLGGFGITCGAHRLWAHRSYKANTVFRVFLMILNSIANQGSIYHWSRDHRLHHKHSDQEGDPHNSQRGFFYSHMGWLLLKKPQAVIDGGKTIDMSDLEADPVVAFQKRFDPWWNQTWCFAIPSLYCYWVYGDFWLGFFVMGSLRWVVCLHATWTVNSVAHLWGERPYSPNIPPADNIFTSVVAVGEGWHNWHHKYPFDYATSEGGIFAQWNPSKLVIDLGYALGMVWDRKRGTGAWELVKQKQQKQKAEKEEAERTNPSDSTKRICVLKGSLPAHCMKKSLLRSTINLARDLMICSLIAGLAIVIKDSSVGRFCSENLLLNQLVNCSLWTIYAIAQGTVAFGVWVLGYEAAGGRFSDYKVVNHTIGLVLHSALMIPYRPRRPNIEKEKASLMRCLREDAFAITKIPAWTAWIFGVAAAILVAGLCLTWGLVYGWCNLLKWYGGPWVTLNCWLMLYKWLLENGPQDCVDDSIEDSALELFTMEWLQKAWPRATRGWKYPWTRLVDHLHHHVSLSHIVQAVDFNVPHYHALEAFRKLGELLDDFTEIVNSGEVKKNSLLSTSVSAPAVWVS